MKSLETCLWFNDQAEEAVKFYTSIFKNSKIGKTARYGESGSDISGQKEGSVMTVHFQIENQSIIALNGGPLFKFNPSLSYFVTSENEAEINQIWKKLSEGGEVRMELDKYPWSEKYGFVADRFGVNWQLSLGKANQKITPAFLFVDKLFGKGQEAIDFYLSLFKNSKINSMVKDETNNTVMHCSFNLNGQDFALMEGQGKHGYEFNDAFSIVINCEDQAEVDYFWDKISAKGKIEQCGWVRDQFGVAWQVVPVQLEKLMTQSDPKKTEKVMKAMLQMKKLDIRALENAAN